MTILSLRGGVADVAISTILEIASPSTYSGMDSQ